MIERRPHRRALALGATALLPLVIAACLKHETAPSQFFVLSSVSATTSGDASDGPGIVVGPVIIPRQLDRPQIVTQTGPNEVTLDEFNRWAEPLADNLTRVVAENLAALVPSDRVMSFPAFGDASIQYAVSLEVTRLDGAPGAECHLLAMWQVRDLQNGTQVSRRSSISRRAPGTGYAGLVQAWSQAVGELSREIATEIQSLSRG